MASRVAVTAPPGPPPTPPATPPPPPARPVDRPRLPARVAAHGDTIAAVILGALFWGWIGLPLIEGGPTRVKNTLRAKFFNKDASGRWLP